VKLYLYLIGGMNKKKLYENAYSDMMNKANLLNTSKAVINIVTEEHVGGVPPFYFKRTVTVSANVIEFVK
jgi:mitochondrial fission protein ELM1